jgi:acyl carrier protein
LQRDAIAQTVIAAIRDTFRVEDIAVISETTTANDIDGWDSLSHTLLLIKLEADFGRQLTVPNIYTAASVRELIDGIDELDGLG